MMENSVGRAFEALINRHLENNETDIAFERLLEFTYFIKTGESNSSAYSSSQHKKTKFDIKIPPPQLPTQYILPAAPEIMQFEYNPAYLNPCSSSDQSQYGEVTMHGYYIMPKQLCNLQRRLLNKYINKQLIGRLTALVSVSATINEYKVNSNDINNFLKSLSRGSSTQYTDNAIDILKNINFPNHKAWYILDSVTDTCSLLSNDNITQLENLIACGSDSANAIKEPINCICHPVVKYQGTVTSLSFGVFATRDINKNEIISLYTRGSMISVEGDDDYMFDRFYDNLQNMRTSHRCFKFTGNAYSKSASLQYFRDEQDKTFIIDPNIMETCATFINDPRAPKSDRKCTNVPCKCDRYASRHANVIMKLIFQSRINAHPELHVVIRAIRNIKRGAEILMDYGRIYWDKQPSTSREEEIKKLINKT